ncbi:integrase catalytic domain-containing protein [Trichonephila clavipes]|nr:integrase catalytic domain-containing protein [Trichonephila clavipes]
MENEMTKSSNSFVGTENMIQCHRIVSFFSKYPKTVRLVGWKLKCKNNCLCAKEKRMRGDLTSFENADLKLVLMIQQESFGRRK